MPIRVLIAGDKTLARTGLRSVLEAAGDLLVVAEATDGAEAVRATRAGRPDVAVVDPCMTPGGEAEVTLQLKRLDTAPKVLALSVFHTDDLVIGTLRAGAAGYLLTDIRPEELVAAVRTVAVGGTVLSPSILASLVSRAGSRMPADAGAVLEQIDSLKESEREVLALIGAGYTNQKIAETLHLSLASVKTYASRMLTRLGLDNRTQAAVLAYEAGLLGTRHHGAP